jgi:hypothetical protein
MFIEIQTRVLIKKQIILQPFDDQRRFQFFIKFMQILKPLF